MLFIFPLPFLSSPQFLHVYYSVWLIIKQFKCFLPEVSSQISLYIFGDNSSEQCLFKSFVTFIIKVLSHCSPLPNEAPFPPAPVPSASNNQQQTGRFSPWLGRVCRFTGWIWERRGIYCSCFEFAVSSGTTARERPFCSQDSCKADTVQD